MPDVRPSSIMLNELADIATALSVFHDGEISGYESDGDALTLRISIKYLAERINSAFSSFSVRLEGVGPVTFRTWPRILSEAPVDLARADLFLGIGLEILDASVEKAGITVICNQLDPAVPFCGGALHFTAVAAAVTDEAGKDYSIDELCELSRAYWDDWASRRGAP